MSKKPKKKPPSLKKPPRNTPQRNEQCHVNLDGNLEIYNLTVTPAGVSDIRNHLFVQESSDEWASPMAPATTFPSRGDFVPLSNHLKEVPGVPLASLHVADISPFRVQMFSVPDASCIVVAIQIKNVASIVGYWFVSHAHE